MIVYFVEQRKISIEQARELGLGYAFEDQVEFRELVGESPSGNRGVVFGRDAKHAVYLPDRQRWEEHVSSPGVWIGFPQQIDVADMIRKEWKRENELKIESRVLKTRSGADWLIPVARVWSLIDSDIVYDSLVPRKLKWNGESFEPGELVCGMELLEEIGEMVVDCYMQEQPALPDDFFKLCSDLFGRIYYAGPQEFAGLGVIEFTADSAWSMLRLVADLDSFNDQVKKKQALPNAA